MLGYILSLAPPDPSIISERGGGRITAAGPKMDDACGGWACGCPDGSRMVSSSFSLCRFAISIAFSETGGPLMKLSATEYGYSKLARERARRSVAVLLE